MSDNDLAGLITVCVTFAITLTSMVHAFFKYRQRSPRGDSALAPNVDHRLAHLEQAVDAIAIEVERISEGQRFTARILTERAVGSAEPARPPELAHHRPGGRDAS